MKTKIYVLLVALLALLYVQSLVAEPRIKLTGRKDQVLSVETRATVLAVARSHLSEKSDDFLALASSAQTPYAFEQPVDTHVDKPVKVATGAIVNYDDASVLRVVAKSFSQQVRGTLARGTTSFLQLKGGNMIKPGTSFPISIPQAQGQTFTITVSEITSNNYILKLGEATQTVSLDTSSTGGAIRTD
jgi:hypothetical protein